MADIAFGHRAEPHAPPNTMDHPSQWHYVAARLMAHMETYSPDEMNWLHRLWHRRAALPIRTAMQRHNIWAIPGSLCYQGHALGHRRPRSQEVPEPPRQTARQDATRGHQPVWFPHPAHTEAPSDHSPRGGTKTALVPRGCRAARQNSTRKQGTLTDSGAAAAGHPAARRVVFHEGTDRGHGGLPANRHHLPPIPAAGPRGPAPSGRTSPPFPAQQSERDRQRSTQATTRPQTVRPARPLPPPQSRPPLRCQGERNAAGTRPRGPAADQRPERGVGGQTPQSPPPPQAGRESTGPRHGHRPPDQAG